jgi:hypothetical protein
MLLKRGASSSYSVHTSAVCNVRFMTCTPTRDSSFHNGCPLLALITIEGTHEQQELEQVENRPPGALLPVPRSTLQAVGAGKPRARRPQNQRHELRGGKAGRAKALGERSLRAWTSCSLRTAPHPWRNPGEQAAHALAPDHVAEDPEGALGCSAQLHARPDDVRRLRQQRCGHRRRRPRREIDQNRRPILGLQARL